MEEYPNGIDVTASPSGSSCVECAASKPHGWWLHLRRCATCGHVGCCDSSPSKHARMHFRATGHQFIQSFEPEEDWYYDYSTGRTFPGPQLAPPGSHPGRQPVPGPLASVPADWRARIS
jgi:hypothetical protein